MQQNFHSPRENIFLAIFFSCILAGYSTPAAQTDSTLLKLTSWYTAMDPSKGTVNLFNNDISFLRGTQATLTGGLTKYYVDPANTWYTAWVQNWRLSTDRFTWNVTATQAGDYEIHALILKVNAVNVGLVSSGGDTVLKALSGTNWDKVVLGTITIPAGTSTLALSASHTTTFNLSLISLELVPVNAKAAIEAEISASKSKATWMKTKTIGMMYQWGQWGGNPNGTATVWPQQYANMDWDAFADRLKDNGADFLVWSVSWATYYVAAPIAAIDSIAPGHTSSVDYLGRILDECEERGIKVIFYYHWGHGSNDFWINFWQVPTAGEHARKEIAIHNWTKIIGEMGNRYGTRLHGWMFDDGRIYYPAPFKILADAARAGNPDRMISFNPWILPRQTDYEDFAFGEGYEGTATNLNNGVYTNGKHTGQQAFGNFRTESEDWGVRAGQTTITTSMSQSTFNTVALSAVTKKHPLAFNFRMWDDGTQNATSLARFKSAVAAAKATVGMGGIAPPRRTVRNGVVLTTNPKLLPQLPDAGRLSVYELTGRRIVDVTNGSAKKPLVVKAGPPTK